jgi:adenylate kinase
MGKNFLDFLSGYAIVKFGRPCCGKNTQASLLEDFLRSEGLPVVSFETSKLLTERLEMNDQIANRIAHYMGRDEIVPADIVCEVVKDFTATLDPRATLIVNGFPRSEEQCFALRDSLHRPRALAIEIRLTREEALHRSQGRNEGRVDDELSRAITRQKVYEEKLVGLRRGLSAQKVVVIKVEGGSDPGVVRDRIIQDLELFLTNDTRRQLSFSKVG